MHLARKHRIAVIAVTALGLATATGATTMAVAGTSGPTAAQQLAALSAGDQVPVIVLMKNQHADLAAKGSRAARKNAATSEQAPLVSHAKSTGAKDVKSFSLVNGFAAKMTAAEAAHLSADPSVAAVIPDRPIPVSRLSAAQKADLAAKAAAAQAGADGQTPADKVLPGTCPTDPAKPLLQPEALGITHTAYDNPSTPQAASLATGKGVKVAWIADGMDIHNPDFQRADGTPVFTDYQDFSGSDPNSTQTGAEAFGDASAIAAQGNQVYDVSKFVSPDHPLPAGCNIRIRGIAPDASLVGLNVFGSAGTVFNSTVVEAIDYAVNVDNVDVINESLGDNAFPTDGIDPTSLADDAAVAAGVTVVASSGDAGVTGTEGQPAADPNVISVAASTSLESQAQNGVGGIRNVATSWADDNAATFSSSGVNDRARVPDLIAPGQNGWAVCTADLSRYSECTTETGQPSPIEDFGGTSQSSPFTAGAAALVIEAYKNTHGGVRPTPALVKQIITSSADDLGLPADQQGAGRLNTYRAVRMAMSVKDANGAPAGQGDGLLATVNGTDSQLSLIAKGDTTQRGTVTLTNTSPNNQVVTAHARELLTKVADVKGTKTVDFTNPANPFFYEGYNHLHRSYFTQQFTIPAGADHLKGMLACPCGGSSSLVRLMLVGPNGEYEEFSDPQGLTNFAQVDIAHPAGGTWTAYFYANGNASGFKGDLSYDFVATKYAAVGSVSPAKATLAPGASQTFTVKQDMPDAAGDVSAAVEFDSATHTTTTVPLTLRTLISASSDDNSFTGVLTGGNARASSPAQTFNYNFDVPKGKKNLAFDLSLANNATGHRYMAALESPDHQVVSLTSNTVYDASGAGSVLPMVQGYVDAPQAGRWTLVIYDTNQGVAGDTLGQKFTGHIRYNQAAVSASGLPHGKVPAGRPVTVTLKVTNHGKAPQQYFADPRLTTAATYDLGVLAPTSATNALPFPVTSTPATFLVPTHTTGLDLEQSSTIRASFDASSFEGQPEVYGTPHGLTASAQLTSPWVTQGQWTMAATATGPTNAAVSGSATDSIAATTLAFDRSAVASTGDLWLGGVDPAAPAVTPLVLNPGQSGTITVVITPTAASGTSVSGVVYLDAYGSAFGSADEVTGVPYTYTVK